MYVLGVDLHLLVQPFGTGDFFLIVQVVQSAIFGGDVQTVVRSIDNLADSLSAQMIETGSVWIYLELVGTDGAGKAKAGERTPGLQLHVHIIVSRMDRSHIL